MSGLRPTWVLVTTIVVAAAALILWAYISGVEARAATRTIVYEDGSVVRIAADGHAETVGCLSGHLCERGTVSR